MKWIAPFLVIFSLTMAIASPSPKLPAVIHVGP